MSRIDPPVPIMVALDKVLAVLSRDQDFLSVPNGNIEIAWRQPAKGRDGNGDRPARYAVTLEFNLPSPPASRSVGETDER